MSKSVSYKIEQERIITDLFNSARLFVESQGVDIDEALPHHSGSKKGIVKQLFNRGYLAGFVITQQEADMIGLPGVGVMPCEPTKAVPGSLGKVQVLAMRVACGQELFNPLDVNCLPTPLRATECGE